MPENRDQGIGLNGSEKNGIVALFILRGHYGIGSRGRDGAGIDRIPGCIWLYLDAEVLVLPPVFLPQDSVFVGLSFPALFPCVFL